MVQPLSRRELSVSCHDRQGFVRLEREWPRLLARTDHEAPFYRHDFLRVWLDNFTHDAPLHVVTVRDGQGLRAALCLVERARLFRGVPVRMLCGTTNVFTERYDLIARLEDEEAIDAVWCHVRDKLSWHVLELPEVPAMAGSGEGAARRLLDRAAADVPTGSWESKHSRYVTLTSSDEAQLEGLSPKFRRSLRARRRRAAARGTLSFERVTAPGLQLDAYLEEGFGLESSGWKGAEGTAIASDPALRSFYTELARTAEAHGYLALSFLRCGARPIAFHFALSSHGRIYLLKVGMDEAWRDCAPGHLLVGDVLRDGFARGLVEFDFLGPDMEWKREWAPAARPHHWLYASRDDRLGRALRGLKFGVRPSWLPGGAR